MNRDGSPPCNVFCFETFDELKSAFENKKVSKFAHCVIAQPVDVSTPSFVMLILGTDSTYTSDVIEKRWRFIETELARRNIKIISYGADGAGPFLKAMVDGARLFLPTGKNIPSDWGDWDFFMTSFP